MTHRKPSAAPMVPRHPGLKKALRFCGMALATLALVALFYLAVILGQPQEPENPVEPLADQPLLAASPAQDIQSESQLAALTAAFPVPVLTFMDGMGPAFVSARSYDQPFEGGYARVMEVRYATDSGMDFTLSTIYPARALSLLPKGDYVLTGAAAQNLTGLTAVRMENAAHIRLHAQANDAVYVLTAPRVSEDSLTALSRALQLAGREGV